MRWQELFADLEGQARSFEQAEHVSEVADRTRAELAQIGLVNRLRAGLGGPLSLVVSGAGEVAGTLRRVGADWLLVSCPDEVIVPLAAITMVRDLPPRALSPQGVSAVASRVAMTSALRAVARDRCVVSATLRDGAVVVGTPDRIGLDFLDLALHDPEGAPRRSNVRARASVALSALATVRRGQGGWV